MYIHIDQNNIKKGIAHMDESVENFYLGTNYVKETVENIKSIWQGEDYNNFQKKMNEFTDELKKVADLMTNYKEYIMSYNNVSLKLEENYKNKKIKLN